MTLNCFVNQKMGLLQSRSVPDIPLPYPDNWEEVKREYANHKRSCRCEEICMVFLNYYAKVDNYFSYFNTKPSTPSFGITGINIY